MTVGTKRCTKCGEIKPLSEFNKDATKSDGRASWCKSCTRISKRDYHNKNRERDNERARLWRENNPKREKDNQHHYKKCVKNPSCQAVGGRGAEFVVFVCEVCDTEFRRHKSEVDSTYERRGTIPRFCSKNCQHIASRKSHKNRKH